LDKLARLYGTTRASLRYGSEEEAGWRASTVVERLQGSGGGLPALDRSPREPRVPLDSDNGVVAPPLVLTGWPHRVRVWLQEFLLALTRGGATESEIETARLVLLHPWLTLFYADNASGQIDEERALQGLHYIAELFREELRARGRDIP